MSLIAQAREQANDWTLNGRWDQAAALLAAIRPLAASVDGPDEVDVVIDLVATRNGQDFLQSYRHGREVVELLDWLDDTAEREDDDAIAAAACFGRALHLHLRFFNDGGDPERERELFDRAIELHRASRNRGGEALATFYRGCVDHVIHADAVSGEPYFDRAYAMATEIGDHVVRGLASRHIGQIHQERGELDEALRRFEESLEARETAGWYVGTAPALIALAEIHRVRGDRDAALDFLARGRAVSVELDAPFLLEVVCTEYEQLARGTQAGGANVHVVIGPDRVG